MDPEKDPLLPASTASMLTNLPAGINTGASGSLAGPNNNAALNFGAFQSAPNIEVASGTRVKLPDFVEEHTDLWFWQVEAAFDAAGITADKKKYNTIIGQLPTRVMYKLADLRTHVPPTGQMYGTLRDRIIGEFADSTQTKITKLLGDMVLGDRKPSQLLAEMRSKAANTPVGEDLLKQLWLRNLPEQIRAIISADDQVPLTTVATMADRIMEAIKGSARINNVGQYSTQPTASVNPVITNPIDLMQRQIDELTRQFKVLNGNRGRGRSQTPSRSSQHVEKSGDSRFDTCWWHHKYGVDARKCKQPCNFSPPLHPNNTQNNSGN